MEKTIGTVSGEDMTVNWEAKITQNFNEINEKFINEILPMIQGEENNKKIAELIAEILIAISKKIN